MRQTSRAEVGDGRGGDRRGVAEGECRQDRCLVGGQHVASDGAEAIPNHARPALQRRRPAELGTPHRVEHGDRQVLSGRAGDPGPEPDGLARSQRGEVQARGENHDGSGAVAILDARELGAEHQSPRAGAMRRLHRDDGDRHRGPDALGEDVLVGGLAAQACSHTKPRANHGRTQHRGGDRPQGRPPLAAPPRGRPPADAAGRAEYSQPEAGTAGDAHGGDRPRRQRTRHQTQI